MFLVRFVCNFAVLFAAKKIESKSAFSTQKDYKMSTTELHGTNMSEDAQDQHEPEKSVPEELLMASLNPKKTSEQKPTSSEEDLAKEEEDQFDASSLPTKHTKARATEDTLQFIYNNSMSSSPSQSSGKFSVAPASSTGNHRNAATKRRPSGVPPPARELKPGDYLYQRNLNNNLDMAEVDEEENELP